MLRHDGVPRVAAARILSTTGVSAFLNYARTRRWRHCNGSNPREAAPIFSIA